MAEKQTKKRSTQTARNQPRLYTLDVFIISGPLAESFVKKNKVISRTIQIRGDQTLQTLHQAIFNAFGREDDHMYEFQVGGKGPMDRKARRYTLHASDDEGKSEGGPAGDVHQTTIESLGLKVNDAFGYWFDFGDDWWHQINVVALEETIGRGKFPKLIKRVGQSPPQYVDWDKEE
ncbi:MAG: plasmid pRiA4b ORF-3 family protein [Blastocatellales bacterium]